MNRCLLLTDGLANKGITDSGELAAHAAALRARGVSTTTFGVGNDFDERAPAGRSPTPAAATSTTSPTPPQIRDAITSRGGGDARDRRPRRRPGGDRARDEIRVEPLSPYTVTSRGGRTVVAIGDLGSEQVVEVVLRLSFPYGDLGREAGAIVTVTDRDGVFGAGHDEPARLTLDLRGPRGQRRAGP